ncbi:MAG: hypothetical protein WA708_10000 [Acidobacteriaceae bacterium]|jgi:hypothetical protein
MRYLRLFSVSFLLTIAIAGCHRRQVRVVPQPQAQAPIVATLPPMPPLTLQDVELAKAAPAKPAPPQVHPETTQKKQVARKHHRRNMHKPEMERPESGEAGSAATNSEPTGSAPSAGSPATVPKTAVLGQLSADDAAAGPDQKEQTRRIIQHTENRLKKLSSAERTKHMNDIAQVDSFLKQAEQAWNMNDLVGAQTLANKAKILMDDLSK